MTRCGLALGAALALIVLSTRVAPAKADAQPRFVTFDTESAVHVERFGVGVLTYTGIEAHETEPAVFTCLSFRNTGARAARAITFHFVDYDHSGNRVQEHDLVRTGRFASGTMIEGMSAKSQTFNREDCDLNPPAKADLGIVFVFVKSVTFDDGSSWSTSGPEIPQKLAQ